MILLGAAEPLALPTYSGAAVDPKSISTWRKELWQQGTSAVNVGRKNLSLLTLTHSIKKGRGTLEILKQGLWYKSCNIQCYAFQTNPSYIHCLMQGGQLKGETHERGVRTNTDNWEKRKEGPGDGQKWESGIWSSTGYKVEIWKEERIQWKKRLYRSNNEMLRGLRQVWLGLAQQRNHSVEARLWSWNRRWTVTWR
jgi:hypothetical protein